MRKFYILSLYMSRPRSSAKNLLRLSHAHEMETPGSAGDVIRADRGSKTWEKSINKWCNNWIIYRRRLSLSGHHRWWERIESHTTADIAQCSFRWNLHTWKKIRKDVKGVLTCWIERCPRYRRLRFRVFHNRWKETERRGLVEYVQGSDWVGRDQKGRCRGKCRA